MRILIIEDSQAVSELMSRYLCVLGSVTVAATMADAMRVIVEFPPFELVTLDLALPDSTTEQTLRDRIKEIRNASPDCLLIVVTGTAQPGHEEEAITYGADGFMHKAVMVRDEPTFLSTLSDIVRSIMRQPVRYQKNLPLLETITSRIASHFASINPTTEQHEATN